MPQQPHILVADDERSIRLMLETGLTLNGFRVTSARTGREALEAAASGHFDAVLSDVYMPDGGGLELVASLRAMDAEHSDRADDRAGLAEGRGGGGGPRRQRFHRQAVRDFGRGGTAAALPGRAPRGRGQRRVDGAGAARPLAVRPGGPQRAHGDGVQADRAGGAHRCHGADHGRIGHGQGTGGARDPRFQPALGAAVPLGELLGPDRYAAGSRSCSATPAAPSPAPPRSAPACSKRPMAARCFWTNWHPPARRFRPACCACCRAGKCGAWAPRRRGG